MKPDPHPTSSLVSHNYQPHPDTPQTPDSPTHPLRPHTVGPTEPKGSTPVSSPQKASKKLPIEPWAHGDPSTCQAVQSLPLWLSLPSVWELPPGMSYSVLKTQDVYYQSQVKTITSIGVVGTSCLGYLFQVTLGSPKPRSSTQVLQAIIWIKLICLIQGRQLRFPESTRWLCTLNNVPGQLPGYVRGT